MEKAEIVEELRVAFSEGRPYSLDGPPFLGHKLLSLQAQFQHHVCTEVLCGCLEVAEGHQLASLGVHWSQVNAFPVGPFFEAENRQLFRV